MISSSDEKAAQDKEDDNTLMSVARKEVEHPHDRGSLRQLVEWNEEYSPEMSHHNKQSSEAPDEVENFEAVFDQSGRNFQLICEQRSIECENIEIIK